MSHLQNNSSSLPNLNGNVARILRKRKASKIVFLTVRVLEQTFQAALKETETTNFNEVRSIPTGSLVRLFGEWGLSENGAETFFVGRVEALYIYTGMMPDKHHGIANDKRHLSRSLDLATNDDAFEYALFGADMIAELRRVLRKWGFREFNTGVLQRRFEGGLASPFTTKCNANGLQYYLSLTSELKLKRLITAGAQRVCEIGQSFRNEGLSKVHSPEFTLLEAYGADMTYLDIMDMVEDLVCSSATVADFELFSGTVEYGSFRRISYRAVCESHIGLANPTLDNLIEKFPGQFQEGMPYFTWVMKLLESVIGPGLVEPVFITELPSGLSPLVKRSQADEAVTDRAFLFAKGYFVCDIYTDENNPEVLEQELRTQAKILGRDLDAEYLECINLGIPPTAGVGLGVNRLQMMFLPDELPNHIRETILFPLG